MSALRDNVVDLAAYRRRLGRQGAAPAIAPQPFVYWAPVMVYVPVMMMAPLATGRSA